MPYKYCGQPSPEEFYKNAMDLNEGKLFSIFGRTAKQILRALYFYDMHSLPEYEPMEKSKMTREEALEITSNDVGLIAKLEQLGLLKFEELKQEKFTIMEAVTICRYTYIENDAFIAGLEKHGYKIVPID